MNAVIQQELSDAPDPVEALELLSGFAGRVLLHSAASGGDYSFLGVDPLYRLRTRGGVTRLLGGRQSGVRERFSDPFSALEAVLQRFRTPTPPDLPFAGGLVGFLGYETADLLERLPPPPRDDTGAPDVWFGVYDCGLLWDRGGGRCRLVATVLPGHSPEVTRRRMECLLEGLSGGRGPVAGPEGVGVSSAARARSVPLGGGALPDSSLSRAGFMAGVERIQERIRAGDLFQANLTRRISVSTPLTGVELYRNLLRESPATYAAYLDTGMGEIASISPELFLSVRAGRVTTRPIKGTARRGATEEEDRTLRESLLSSAKDRAENVMIVDLLRNDLSRVSRTGSVSVPELAALETHPTVHHLVSTVTGDLRSDVGSVELLRATFPGGSITGAPKIQAIRLLREVEPVRRGVYTGALGILGFHGELDLSIAIRTAYLRDGRVHYGTGGGITLGSEAEAEWRETEDKAQAFLRAVGVV